MVYPRMYDGASSTETSLAGLDVTIVNSPSKSKKWSWATFGTGMIPGLASDSAGLYHMGDFCGTVNYNVGQLVRSSRCCIESERYLCF